jgi:hypothetical protein
MKPFPSGLDFDYEPSIASHDPLDDDLVPECPPPDVFPEDVPDEDEDPVHGLHQVWQLLQVLRAMQLQCCLRIMFKGCFKESFDQGGQIGCLGATSTPEKKIPKHGKGGRNRVGKDVLFEFACAKGSNCGKVGQKSGVRVIRLCKEDINLEDPHSIEQLIAQVGALPLFHRMRAMEPMATLESGKIPKTDSTNPSRASRERCIGGTIYSGS